MGLKRLSLSEEELMNVFWKIGTPITSVDILQYAKDKTWSGNYIHKMLRELEEKKFIEMCGAEKHRGRLVRQFNAIVSREDYATFFLEQQGLSTKALADIAVAFVKKKQIKKKKSEADQKDVIDEQLIKKLQEMVDALKEEE